ncbi:hypothetical protein [Paenibacillus campi]|uniref:hypothetical protein n=1 Tax=Paenibacillus campi TaxID=3106031 RepID=UPI002AFEC4A0|nr:hypothetical protein [Paenibacillus sp. SGZ-1009]
MKKLKLFFASLTVVAALATAVTPIASAGTITPQGCYGSYADKNGEIVPCGS